MAVQYVTVDSEAGIPDLVRRLADDSKRLVADEVRLAKLELRESVRRGGRGAMLLGVAFAFGVVALVMLTVLLATLLSRVTGHAWSGTLVTGLLALAAGIWLVQHGLALGRSTVSEAKHYRS